jgi:hypothetical protein
VWGDPGSHMPGPALCMAARRGLPEARPPAPAVALSSHSETNSDGVQTTAHTHSCMSRLNPKGTPGSTLLGVVQTTVCCPPQARPGAYQPPVKERLVTAHLTPTVASPWSTHGPCLTKEASHGASAHTSSCCTCSGARAAPVLQGYSPATCPPALQTTHCCCPRAAKQAGPGCKELKPTLMDMHPSACCGDAHAQRRMQLWHTQGPPYSQPAIHDAFGRRLLQRGAPSQVWRRLLTTLLVPSQLPLCHRDGGLNWLCSRCR